MHHLSHLISLPALLLKTKGPKRTIPSFDWNRKTTVTKQKVSKLGAFQNLEWILNLNTCIYILVGAAFHRCRGFVFFFQVHLFVAQVISIAKCTSGTSGGGMKDREKQ